MVGWEGGVKIKGSGRWRGRRVGKQEREEKIKRRVQLTTRIPRPLRRTRETPQIQHPANRQVEKARRILRNGQLAQTGRVVRRQRALTDVGIRARDVVVEIAGEPGVDGAGGDEADVEDDGGRDADLVAARGAHGVRGVQDVSTGLKRQSCTTEHS